MIIKYKTYIYLLVILIINFQKAWSQDVASITSIKQCGQSMGSITIIMDENLFDETWSYPMGVQLTNDETDNYIEATIFDQNDLTITGLPAGIYTVNIDVSDYCSIELQTEIFKVDFEVIIPQQGLDCQGNFISLGIDQSLYEISWYVLKGADYVLMPENSNLSIIYNILPNTKYKYEVSKEECYATGEMLTGSNLPHPINIGDPAITFFCKGNKGKIIFTSEITGGTSPYTYLWSNGETTASIVQLDPGSYTITVTDSQECSSSRTFKVSENNNWNLIKNISPSCIGLSTGSILLSGIPANAQFQWNDATSSTTNPIINLAAGNYCVTISFASCTLEDCIDVPALDALGPFTCNEVIYSTCLGASNGMIELYVEGGNPPYAINWHDGSTLAKRENLAAGSYAVTITDDCGRLIQKTMTVNNYNYSNISITGFAKDGYEGGNLSVPSGSIIITNISGGSGNFNYHWDKLINNGWIDFSNSKDIYNLGSGTYKLEVTDKESGCKKAKTFKINNDACSTLNLNLDVRRTDTGNERCDGPPGEISMTHFFGLPPVLPVMMKITGDDGYTKIYNLNEDDFIDNSSGFFKEKIVLSNLKRQGYTITAEDACARKLNKNINLCVPCGKFEFDFSDKDDHFILIPGTGVRIKIQCACVNDNCEWWDLGIPFLHRTLLEIDLSEGCPPLGLDLEIVWPDGNIGKIHSTINTGFWGKKGLVCEVEGDDSYVIKDEELGKEIFITIKRNDGCDDLIIPFTVNGINENVFFFPTFGGSQLFFTEYYGATASVATCSSNPAEPSYLTTNELVESGTDGFNLVFVPSYPYAEDPCNSGGKFEGLVIEDGFIGRKIVDVPPGISKGGEKSNWAGNAALSDPLGQTCENGGYCLFDAEDLYGVKLDKLLRMPWCSIYKDDPPDTDPNPNPDTDPDTTPDSNPNTGCDNDIDCDGIGDDEDNCPDKANELQKDWDKDGIGDVCDNCVKDKNFDQVNSDTDKLGDRCDNCITQDNQNQADSDKDGVGDVCDDKIDSDFDEIIDGLDNCPNKTNPSQINSDTDSWGDVCDNCDKVNNEDQLDSDEDKVGDLCDNCPAIQNTNQDDGCICPEILPPVVDPIIGEAEFIVKLPKLMNFALKITYPDNSQVTENFFNKSGIIKLKFKPKVGEYGDVSIELVCNYPPGCFTKVIVFTVKKPQIKGPDDPSSNANCNDPVDVVYNEITNEFIYFWDTHAPTGENLIGEVIETNGFTVIREFTRVKIKNTIIKFVRIDHNGNLLVISEINGGTNITLFSPDKTVIWESWISGIIITEIPGHTITYPNNNCFGISKSTNTMHRITLHKDGTYELQNIGNIPCKNTKGDCPQLNIISSEEYFTTTQSYTSTTLTWFNGLGTKTKTYLGKLDIKHIKKLETGEYVIVGNFENSITIADSTYISTPGNSTIIFIWIDEFFEVTDVKLILVPWNQIIKNLNFNNNGTFVYTSFVVETLVLTDSTEVSIDSCGFVNGMNTVEPITRDIGDKIDIYDLIQNNINIYPNPFTNGVTIDIRSFMDEDISLKVVNSTGQTLFIDELPLTKGENRYYLKKSEAWPNGVYNILLNGRTIDVNKKLIKIR